MPQAVNYVLNPLAIPTIVTALAILGLGFAVLLRENASRASMAFALLTVSVSDWLVAMSLVYCATNETTALFWAKIAYIGIPLIPSAVYSFTIILLGIESEHLRELLGSWIVSALFVGLLLGSNRFLIGVHHFSWGYFPRLSSWAAVFVLFFIGMLLASLRHYTSTYKSLRRDVQRTRVRSFLVAFAVGYLALIDYVPAFGVGIYPIGFIAVAGFCLLIARAIVRHRLAELTPGFAAKQILETIEGAVIVTDSEHRIRVVNRGAADMLAYRESDMVGLPISNVMNREELVPEETLSRIPTLRNFAMSWKTSRGTSREVAVSVSPLKDEGETIGTVYVGLDITELRAAEKSIERLNRRNELLLHAAGEGIYGVDRDGRITFLNPAGARMLGCSEFELIGQSQHERIHRGSGGRESHSENACPVRRSIDRGMAEHMDEAVFHRTNGTDFPADFISTPIIEEGNIVGAVVTFNDVTERKFAEAQRNEMLRAQEVNRAKDDFFATVSHELRSPITAILGWIQLLRKEHTSDENLMSAFEAMEQSAQAQLRLVEDLLESSRIASGILDLQRTEFDLGDALTAAVDAMKPVAREKEVVLELQKSGNAIVNADPARIRQIVWNLISNAIKFTPPGGRIDVSLHVIRNTAEIMVHDTGKGIALEFLPKVFERHAQELRGSGGGLGLGLSIVKHLVERHGGRVSAESEGPGRGATFRITLPTVARIADTRRR